MHPEGRNVYGADLDGEEYELRSPGDPTYNVAEERDARIIEWRTRCFKGLGFTELNAAALAVRRDVDRARVERMLGAGASHVQVMAVEL